MVERIVEWLQSIAVPAELIVVVLAMTPISELRGAIPIGMGIFGMSVWKATLLSVLGNILIIIPVLLLLDHVVRFLMKYSKTANKIFTWLFDRTRRKHSEKIELYGEVALMTFVAIPLPGTGAWSGILIAYVFGLPFWKAFTWISLGVIIAGIVVALISTSAFTVWGYVS